MTLLPSHVNAELILLSPRSSVWCLSGHCPITGLGRPCGGIAANSEYAIDKLVCFSLRKSFAFDSLEMFRLSLVLPCPKKKWRGGEAARSDGVELKAPQHMRGVLKLEQYQTGQSRLV